MANPSEKPKRTLTKLTLRPSETGKAINIRELEKSAIWAEKEFAGVHYKMREVYPTLHGIHDHFTNNVRGSVTGDVHAGSRLTLGGSGSVQGDVRASRLQVDEGAVVNGAISMVTNR